MAVRFLLYPCNVTSSAEIIGEIAASAPGYVRQLLALREVVLADAVMGGEIPAPTFHEEARLRFLSDRFTESGNVSSVDELGNVSTILAGAAADRERNLLVIAHADSVWESGIDHTITAAEGTLSGPGLTDNSLGISALASLPLILDRLGIRLEANLILLGVTRSLGQGDLAGIRFFLDHTELPVSGALCVEGARLGRLSYTCLGMARAEISVTVPEEPALASGAIGPLNEILQRILGIHRPEQPRTQIILGSVNAGSGFNTPSLTGWLRFEVRSEDAGIVDRILAEMEVIIQEINARGDGAAAELTVIARRQPGDLGFGHNLVRAAREILTALGVKTKVIPSMSELSALLDKGIPGLTLGLTTASNANTVRESVNIEPLFQGLAQLVAMIQVLDHLSTTDERP